MNGVTQASGAAVAGGAAVNAYFFQGDNSNRGGMGVGKEESKTPWKRMSEAENKRSVNPSIDKKSGLSF